MAIVGWLALVGAVQVAGPFVLIGAGEEEISSGLAGILVASTPLFTALLAIWVDQEERSSGLRLVGIGVGLSGVALLLGVDLGGGGAELVGGLMVVLAALGYAIGGFLVKRRLSGIAPLGMSAAVMLASALFLLPAALLTAPEEVPGLGPLAAVAVLGVLGTGIAFVIFYGLIASIGPARAFLVTYIAPGFAVVYGATLLSEEVTAATLVGLGLILAGSWLAAEGRAPWRRGAGAGSARAGRHGAGGRGLPQQRRRPVGVAVQPLAAPPGAPAPAPSRAGLPTRAGRAAS